MTRKQKLELTWVGKDERSRLEPRIFLEEPELSYHATHRVSEADRFDNLLIQGDNLLALKALEQEYRGQVKCIFIDPPYNTGSAFTHYDDGLEHSLWLSMMRDRLELLRELLSKDGSIWITIDDNEAHYLKVLGDEVFGRQNFICDISWQKRDGPPNDRKIGSIHDHVLVWGKEKLLSVKKTLAEEAFNLMPRTEKADAQYQVFSEPTGLDPRGPFRKIDTTANGKGGRHVDSLVYPIRNPFTGDEVWPRKGTCWRHNREDMEKLQAEGRLYWGVQGTARTPMRKLFKSEAKQGMSAPSIWTDVGLNQHASTHLAGLFGEKAAFETPKPEELLSRILVMATNHGDLVLDSFAGSGTTGAVAHKMGRHWIMVELGDHCHTHIVPRLRKVIDGNDPGGVTASAGWKGGGGFRYYRLAPSLLREDTFGNLIINPEYRPEMLTEAVCKLMGYTYAPSEQHYWQHGQASERDFLYVTTASLTHEQLRALSEDIGPDRTLLVCCKAFRAKAGAFENLTIQKIPQTVLDRCEWGRDDYSLRIANLPPTPEQTDAEAPTATTATGRGRGRKQQAGTPDLFSQGDNA